MYCIAPLRPFRCRAETGASGLDTKRDLSHLESAPKHPHRAAHLGEIGVSANELPEGEPAATATKTVGTGMSLGLIMVSTPGQSRPGRFTYLGVNGRRCDTPSTRSGLQACRLSSKPLEETRVPAPRAFRL